MSNRLPVYIAASFCLLPLSAISSWAADLYVSASSGSDSNAGTVSSAPLKTITRAAALAKAGTTVHVAPGTYYENVVTRLSGALTAHIRFVSDTKWGAKVIGSGTNAMWLNSGNYVEITGFDISGPGRLGIENDGSYVLMNGNHVHNLTVSGGCSGGGGAGIDNSNYSASDNDIIGNVVHDIGTPGACNGVQGIYTSNLRGRIINNIVYRVSSFGIHLWHAANRVTIVNNTVFDNGSSTMGGGIVLGTGDSPGGVVLDNTFVANNIVYRNPAASIVEYCSSGSSCIGSNVVVTHNLESGNGHAIKLLVGAATNTVNADPEFVNYQVNGTGDLHLKNGSPAIDQGTSTSAPNLDIEGNSRPSGAGYDIGAYEYVAPVVAPSPSPTSTPVTGPVISLSATSFKFGSVRVGYTSAAQTLTIKNTGKTNLSFTSAFVFSTGFSGSGNCYTTTPLAPGASCSVSLKFKPTSTGAKTGTMKITTNAPSSPNVVSLSGTGY